MNFRKLASFIGSAALLFLTLAVPDVALAQSSPSLATVVATCGTPPSTYSANQNRPVTQDTTGILCTSTGGGGGGSDVNITQVGGNTVTTSVPVSGAVAVTQPTAANLNATVVGTGTFATQSTITPGQRTYVTLDVKTVTTGGTPVTAVTAGHHTAGGFLSNPKGATIDLCINEIGTASGTTSSGDTTCIPPGATYTLAPAAGTVSVVTSDGSHPFSGYGLQ